MLQKKLDRFKILDELDKLLVPPTAEQRFKERKFNILAGDAPIVSASDSAIARTGGLIPGPVTEKPPTASEIKTRAFGRLVSEGLMDPATRDSFEAGIKKTATPREPSFDETIKAGFDPIQKESFTNKLAGIKPEEVSSQETIQTVTSLGKEIKNIGKAIEEANERGDERTVEVLQKQQIALQKEIDAINNFGSFGRLVPETAVPENIPQGAQPTGRKSGGKPVYQLPNGDYWVQD